MRKIILSWIDNNMNHRKVLYSLAFVIIFSVAFIYQGDYQYVGADEVTEDDLWNEATEPLVDIANSSVSYSGDLYDFVEWKIKLLGGDDDAIIDMSLRAPNGNIIHVNYDSRDYEVDENGCYTLKYFVPEVGPGDGLYQIYQLEIAMFVEDQSYETTTVTNGYNGIDLSSLSFVVTGQKEDTIAPKINKENIVICYEKNEYNYERVLVEIPVIEDGSGIQELWIEYGNYYDKEYGFWYFMNRGTVKGTVRPNPLGVVSESIGWSELKKGVVYGISRVWAVDWAGNTTVVDLHTGNDDTALDYIPEQYRFSTDNIHVHTYDSEWTTDILPTCQLGIKSRHCTKSGCPGACDFEEIESTSEHVYGEWEVTKEATCNVAGLKERYCSVCGELSATEEIPATGQHIYDEWKVTKEATCNVAGLKERTCSVCKSTTTEAIPATGQHTYGEWKVTKEATFEEVGLRERVCSVCGTKETEEISATGYTTGVEFKKGNNIYSISSVQGKAGTVTYTGVTKKTKTVTIPDQVVVDDVTYKVTSIADNAMANNTKVTKVILGKNITSVGKNAFKKCTRLKTVEVKSTKLSKIGANAFNGAKKLTKITLKTTKLTKKSIGKNALKGTSKQLVIKVPKSKVTMYNIYFKNKGNKTVKVKK